MQTETKAAFARRHGVNRSTVQKWQDKGLLVIAPDGMVNVEATEWNLDQRPAKYRGGTAHRPVRTAPRDMRTIPQEARTCPQAEEEPEGGLLIVLATLVGMVGKLSAEAAVASGASMRVAYALDSITTVHLWNEAERMLGIPPGSVSGFETMVDKRVVEPDWDDLAAQAGEPVDTDAWDAFVAAHPMLQPPPA
ncbi:hypothetical protein BV511_14850 [Methylorubrum extorquens]|uniref:hypothetical protein n=1 Tax=Methylorubrum extorquens TaxID=408 RepID=UPI0006FF3CD5|nr:MULTISPECIES: hypothetical protein [Methylorubrum]APX85875.1 hypothetical protein BV511_14850 [Methylorubrum extorquens]ARO57208.1 hypothetical protein B2G69_25640 [Methylorubrum zatmanii]KQQ04575.1 hypothetical protein ASF59_02115 [Methylobacterium sp. Leaf121]